MGELRGPGEDVHADAQLSEFEAYSNREKGPASSVSWDHRG